MNLSISEENHIKHIFHLQESFATVSTNQLAQKLQTKAASVTDMLKKLSAKEIIQYEAYKGFALTDDGNKIALAIVRKHRLWEYFLSETLGFDWDKIHDIAEQLEHIDSVELINKLDDFLGNPMMDPHGDLIPSRTGKMPKVKRLELLHAPMNKIVVVCTVSNQSKQMLQILTHHNISIGSKLKITKRFLFDDSLEIKIGQSLVNLSALVAKNILVYDESVN